MSKYTYIVTGCTGYVGNQIVKKLLNENEKVIGLARDKTKFKKVFKDQSFDVIYGDIRDKKTLEDLFIGDGPFVVIHTAALISIGEYSYEELYDVNVNGTNALIEVSSSKNLFKFLHISSSEAIPKGLRLKPDLSNYIPNPKKVSKGYNRTKSIADLFVLEACEKMNFPASILIMSGVLGPGDYSNSHMTQMFKDYIEGNLIASIKGGYNDFDIRDFTFVLKNIVYNSIIGESYFFANRPDTINEMLEVAKDLTNAKDIKTLPLWVAYVGLPFLHLKSLLTKTRPLYTKSALDSLHQDVDFPIEKAKKAFGFNPRPLEETVKDHISFMIEENMVNIKKKGN